MPLTFRLGRWMGVLALSGIILSGCSHNKGLVLNNRATDQLEQADKAFMDKDYDTAWQIYQATVSAPGPDDIRIAARYGLVCINMATADSGASFSRAASVLLASDTLKTCAGKKPQFFIRALGHGLPLVETEQKEAQSKMTRCTRIQAKCKQDLQAAGKDRTELKKKQEQINTLLHQIAILEKIEQERQKQRKAQ